MSWIQDLFYKLKKADEEPSHYNEIYPENKNDDSSYDYKKVDAKVTYQYPKGKFRFPLIPDEARGVAQRENRKTAHQNSKTRKHSYKEEGNKKEDIQKSTKYSSVTRNNRPFRPTEIPSPIFGFNRPKEQEYQIVEHELSCFTEEPVPVAKDHSFIQTEFVNDHLRNDSQTEEEIENNQFDQLVSMEVEGLDQNDEEDSLKNRSFQESGMSIFNQSEAENIVTVAEEDNHYEQVEEIIEEAEVETTPQVLELEQEMEEENAEKEKPRRTHLPFNVLMLKQDKQKWVQKSVSQNLIKVEEEPLPESMVQDEKTSLVQEHGTYEFPTASLLNPPITENMDVQWVKMQEELLNETLENFNVGAKVVNVTQGPSVTRFEVQPEPGVKVNKITNLTDDIKLSLAAKDIRMEAPIPGKHTIGIEVPNLKSRPVFIREIIQSEVFLHADSPLTAVLGLDISGKPIVTDLKKMPHGLIAGATGSGKSVCINSILVSLLYKASPEDLKLLLIDPKMVELAPYNHIPHLVSPVITDVKAATSALKWAVEEMEHRYELFAHTGVRDINRFNELAMKHKQYSDKLPFIVIVIDELADLMMMSPADVEEAICRIAQKARACGIHLIIATQRPSVDVITGLIKANIPTRIAFSVSSQVDSRTIIDISGAEKLLGRGDMLFLENGTSKPIRLQGTFVSDDEIDGVVEHIRQQREPEYLFQQEELLKKAQISDEEDELFYEACEFVVEQGGASTSSLQRRFKIGYNRAARLMDLMEDQGFISGSNGSKPREVLITESDLQSMQTSSSI